MVDAYHLKEQIQWTHTRTIGATLINASFGGPKVPISPEKFMKLPRIDKVRSSSSKAVGMSEEDIAAMTARLPTTLPTRDTLTIVPDKILDDFTGPT
jgi:hypothetical protein